MTTTLEKRPAHRLRSSFWNTPVDRFFRNDFLDFWDGNTMTDTTPSLNIKEEKDQYKIELAAPGLKKEDFNIDVDRNMLTVSSEKETETTNGEAKKNDYSRVEYNYSSFSRSVSLPDYADSKGISAKYTDGILHISIPKKPEAQKSISQKITVQ